MCCKDGSKRFFVLLLNSQKMVPLAPRSLEVFKERPDLNKIIEWARKLKVDELSQLQVMPIEVPFSRLL
jgi:hypothetical protein